MARLIPMDREEVKSGEKIFAQLILEEPAIAMAGDRFVIRSYSPVTTIGGGVILDPHPPKHKRFKADVLEEFTILLDGDDATKAGVIIGRTGLDGITLHELVVRTGMTRNLLRKILDRMFSDKEAILLDKEEIRVVSYAPYGALLDHFLEELGQYHRRNPLRTAAGAAGEDDGLFDVGAASARAFAARGAWPRRPASRGGATLRVHVASVSVLAIVVHGG